MSKFNWRTVNQVQIYPGDRVRRWFKGEIRKQAIVQYGGYSFCKMEKLEKGPKSDWFCVANDEKRVTEKQIKQDSDNKNKLINFMIGKQAKLGSEVDYFNIQDIRSIETLNDIQAQNILERMKGKITENTKLLDYNASPFCYLSHFNKCRFCNYSRIHGKCSDSSSDASSADKIASKHNLLVGKLITKLGIKDEPEAAFKLWSDKSEEDHPRQIYLFAYKKPDGEIIVDTCYKDRTRTPYGSLLKVYHNIEKLLQDIQVNRSVTELMFNE